MSVKHASRSIIRPLIVAASTFGAPALLLSVGVTPACSILGSPGPSMVSQGKQYQAGEPTYDQYFQELYELQIELAKAPADEKEIRATMAKKARVDEDLSGAALAKRFEKKAQELEAAGTGLKLEAEGFESGEDPKATLTVKGKELEGPDKEMIRAAEAGVLSSLKLAARMRKAKKMIEQLNATALALEANVKTAFRKGGPSKQAEVRKNLDDAKKLLPLMDARAESVGESARTTAKKIAEVLATDKGQFDAPPPPVEPPPEAPVEPEKTDKKPPGDKKPTPPVDKKPPPVDKKPTPPPDKPPPSDFEP